MLGLIAYPLLMSTVTGPASAAAFPVSNLSNNDYGRVWRSSSAAVGFYTIDIDLGSAQAIDCVAFLWHNLRSGDMIQVHGATSVANLNAAVGYVSGYTSAVTGGSLRDYVIPYKYLLTLPSVQTYRYWRINIQVAGTALPAGFIQASRMLFMKKAVFVIGPSRVNMGAEDRNIRLQLESGEERSSEDRLLIRPTCMLDFSYGRESEMAEVVGKYTLSLGTSRPMFICSDITAGNLQDRMVFGRPQKVIEAASDSYDIWKFQAQVTSIGP